MLQIEYFHRNFSMTLSYNYFTYAKRKYRNDNGKYLLAELPEKIVSVPIGIVAKKVKSYFILEAPNHECHSQFRAMHCRAK